MTGVQTCALPISSLRLLSAYQQFRLLVQRGGKWDFAETKEFKTEACPTLPACLRTVTLCGLCMQTSTLGNVHYGFVGTAGGILPSTLFGQASKVDQTGSDPQDAHEEIQLGIDLWNGQTARGPYMGPDLSRLCDLVRSRRDKLRKTERTAACTPCREPYGVLK